MKKKLKITFFRYVNIAIDFKKNTFMTEKEKFEETSMKRERGDLINFEIEKTNRFLNILTNHVPIEKKNLDFNMVCKKQQYGETDIKYDIEKYNFLISWFM